MPTPDARYFVSQWNIAFKVQIDLIKTRVAITMFYFSTHSYSYEGETFLFTTIIYMFLTSVIINLKPV